MSSKRGPSNARVRINIKVIAKTTDLRTIDGLWATIIFFHLVGHPSDHGDQSDQSASGSRFRRILRIDHLTSSGKNGGWGEQGVSNRKCER